MSFFNAVVFCEHEKIKLKIEIVTTVDQITQDAGRKINDVNVSIKSPSQVDFKNKKDVINFPVFIDEELVVSKLERIIFKAQKGSGLHQEPEQEQDYYRDAIVYECPTTISDAINFIKIINDFVRYNCSSAALLDNKSIDDSISNDQLDRPVLYFFDEICSLNPPLKTRFNHPNRLITNLLNLEAIPDSYQPVLTLLTNIKGYAFNNYVQGRNQDKIMINDIWHQAILANDDPFCLLNPACSSAKKKTFIAAIYHSFVAADRQDELYAFFNDFNQLAIKKLYKPCLGKIAYDGKRYNFSYTEWHVLKNAQFNVRLDGRMSIINLQNNKKYIEHYGENAPNRDLFAPEMRYLGQVLGLDFANDSDFHDELIFTPESTKKLKEQGLHYNEIYLKKLAAKNAVTQAYCYFFSNDKSVKNESSTYSITNFCSAL